MYLPSKSELKLVKTIILTELIGIKMAATMGDIVPFTAKEIPIMLYIKDITKLTLIILTEDLA